MKNNGLYESYALNEFVKEAEALNSIVCEIEQVKKMELLKPSDITGLLSDKVSELKKLYEKLIKNVKKSPEGSLYAHKSNGSVQYCFRKKKSEKEKSVKKGTENDCVNKEIYIGKKNISFARQLAQRRYFEDCCNLLERQIGCLENTLKIFEENNLDIAFDSLPELIKPLVVPVTLSNEEYAKTWLEVEYGRNPNHQIEGGLYTADGVHVRSKSEVIIGDVLFRMGVPFRYEYPVEINRAGGYGSYTAYPDFYCLNVRTRQEMVWEHFGMMDDSEYVGKMIKKLADYQRTGWLYGQNMIFTMETASQQLDIRNVEFLVKKFLL